VNSDCGAQGFLALSDAAGHCNDLDDLAAFLQALRFFHGDLV
jgi:hypothetical protein